MGMLLNYLFQFNITNYVFSNNLVFCVVRKSVGFIMHINFKSTVIIC